MQNKSTTNFIDKEEILNGFQKSIINLKEKLFKTEKAFSENLNPLDKESYHFISRLLVPETRWDRILYSHIFKTALQSEKLSATSSYISVLTAISFIETLLKHKDFLQKNEYEVMEIYQTQIAELQKNFQSITKPLTKNLSPDFIDKICKDSQLSTAIFEAMELSGMEGNIQIENGEGDSYTVELRYGYHFPAKIYKLFLPTFGMWLQTNCKIFLVDGIVEKVSEIDHILRKSFETKIPLIFVAQGFSEEILATLKTNYDKKNFNIFPVVLGTDLDSLNVLNDISSVTGCKVLSTLTGDMLIYANYDDLPLVDLIKCTENGMLIQHTKNRGAVAAQIKSLIEKRKEQDNRGILDVTSLFDKRISNLLAHTVVIRLPNFNKIENEYIRTKIDISLRTIKSLIAYGYMNLEDIKSLSVNLESKIPLQIAIKETLKNITEQCKTNDKIPTLSVALGLFFTGKSMIQLMCSGGIVVSDYP